MKLNRYTFGQVEALFNILGGEGVVDGILAHTLKVVVKVIALPPFTQKLTVNYDRSIEDLVAAGDYDSTNRDVTDNNFPSSESSEKEVEFGMFHYGECISSEKAIANMEEAGFRPATMKELLSYGEKNPEEQREYLIIALGSHGSHALLKGDPSVGCLFIGSTNGRRVSLRYFEDGFGVSPRFLGVRI
jgi:hypothetical protein